MSANSAVLAGSGSHKDSRHGMSLSRSRGDGGWTQKVFLTAAGTLSNKRTAFTFMRWRRYTMDMWHVPCPDREASPDRPPFMPKLLLLELPVPKKMPKSALDTVVLPPSMSGWAQLVLTFSTYVTCCYLSEHNWDMRILHSCLWIYVLFFALRPHWTRFKNAVSDGPKVVNICKRFAILRIIWELWCLRHCHFDYFDPLTFSANNLIMPLRCLCHFWWQI